MKTNALRPSRTLRTVLLAAFLMAAAAVLAPKPANAGLMVSVSIGGDRCVPRPVKIAPSLCNCGHVRSERGLHVRNGGKHQRRVVKCGTKVKRHRRQRHARQVWVAGHWEQVSRRTARWVPGHWERV